MTASITTVRDEIVRCVVDGGTVRLVAALTTATSREAARRHGASAGAALALARGTTAGLLLATLTKDQERVTLQVLGDGPLGGITVDANSEGGVRAYLKNPSTDLPLPSASAPDAVAAAVGQTGLVSVIRDLGMRENFSGQTAITSGEIDADVEHYLAASEQIDSALACDAVFYEEAQDGGVAGVPAEIMLAGGVLVQALPGSEGAPLVAEMRQLFRSGALGRVLREQPLTAETLARAILPADTGMPAHRLQVLDTRAVRFACPCSRERAIGSLALLGPDELGAMILEDGKADVICNFCREHYHITKAELESLRHPSPGTTDRPN